MIAGRFLPDLNARFDLSLTNPEETVADMFLLRRYVLPSRPLLGLLTVARSMRTEVIGGKMIRGERKNEERKAEGFCLPTRDILGANESGGCS